MPTNIEIDEVLRSEATTASSLPNKRATVEAGLRILLRIARQETAFDAVKGMGWAGELNAMRGRFGLA